MTKAYFFWVTSLNFGIQFLKAIGMFPGASSNMRQWEKTLAIGLFGGDLIAWAMVLFLVTRIYLRFDLDGLTIKDIWRPTVTIPWRNIRDCTVYAPSIAASKVALTVSSIDELLGELPIQTRRSISKHFIFGPNLVLFSTEDFKITIEQLRNEIESRSGISIETKNSLGTTTIEDEFTKPSQSAKPGEFVEAMTWGATVPKRQLYSGVLFTIVLLACSWISSYFAGDMLFIGLACSFLTAGLAVLLFLTWKATWLTVGSEQLSYRPAHSTRTSIPWKYIESTQVVVDLHNLKRTLEVKLIDKWAYLASLSSKEKNQVNVRIKTDGILAIPLAELGALPQDIQPEISRRIQSSRSLSS